MASMSIHSKCSENSTASEDSSSRTCSEVIGAGNGGGGFMLFGVRVSTDGSFRKSVSMNNLAQYDSQHQESNNDPAAGYESDDVVHPSGRSCERKRGVAWSEEEHRLFLLGLQKLGKGDWRGISRNYVKTRTPTQVASHAQKYFLRRTIHNRRRRRSSLFDITTDAVAGSAVEHQLPLENSPQVPIIPQQNLTMNPNKFPMSTIPVAITPLVVPIIPENPMENLPYGQINQLTNSPKPIRPIPILPIPPSSKMANLNLNTTIASAPQTLSLDLSISSRPVTTPQPPPSHEEQPPLNQPSEPARHASALQGIPGSFSGSCEDGIISVA